MCKTQINTQCFNKTCTNMPSVGVWESMSIHTVTFLAGSEDICLCIILKSRTTKPVCVFHVTNHFISTTISMFLAAWWCVVNPKNISQLYGRHRPGRETNSVPGTSNVFGMNRSSPGRLQGFLYACMFNYRPATWQTEPSTNYSGGHLLMLLL